MAWFHPYHLVEISPWPIMGSMALLGSALCLLSWVNKGMSSTLFVLSFIPPVLVVTQWWRDVVRESTMLGFHTLEVCKGLKVGFLMFIISEVMFFFSFFFSYMFLSLNPDVSVGGSWPPVGLQPISFMGVPLSNTIILLSSGVSITWAHHSILSSKKGEFMVATSVTVALAILFLTLQGQEYVDMSFTMSDSSYGSLFFMMTGFHGLHVFVGTVFIVITLLRGLKGQFSEAHHLGFEFSAWYWHFVDVVWLALYVMIYWWGS